ncbi:MAG TPA: hypothetical protein DEQ84_05660 [Prevotellaceae bacterium]|nr:hypothetical protein [Prevotellaceae bacterium]
MTTVYIRMKKIGFFSLLCLSSFFHVGQAQKVWTLQECIDYALTNNIQVQKNKIAAQTAEQNLIASKAARLPTLSANSNQNVAWRPFSQQTINLTNGTMTTSQSLVNYNGSYALSGNWTVWNGGRIGKNIEKNKYSQRIAELETEQTANSIQEQIAQIYIQILYENEAVKIDSANIKVAEMQLARAKERVNVGDLAKVDVAQLEAQLTQDKYALVSAQAQLETYKLQLRQLLEIHGDEPFDVAIPTVGDESVLAAVPSKTSVYEAALGSRPEVESSNLDIASAKLDKDIAKASWYPSISANAGIGSSHSSGIHTGAFKQLKTNMSNTLGLTISIPISDQKQTKTAVQKAELAIRNSELNLEDTRKQLYSNVENHWLNATTAQQQYIAANANVKSMQESYDLISEQFRLGLKNIVELTVGKNNLLQAEGQKLQSKYTALYNLAMLRFYQGEKMRL